MIFWSGYHGLLHGLWSPVLRLVFSWRSVVSTLISAGVTCISYLAKRFVLLWSFRTAWILELFAFLLRRVVLVVHASVSG